MHLVDDVIKGKARTTFFRDTCSFPGVSFSNRIVLNYVSVGIPQFYIVEFYHGKKKSPHTSITDLLSRGLPDEWRRDIEDVIRAKMF